MEVATKVNSKIEFSMDKAHLNIKMALNTKDNL